MMAYRILMLLWALWLASAVLKWATWGWDCFTHEAGWKKTAPLRPFHKGDKAIKDQNTERPPTKVGGFA